MNTIDRIKERIKDERIILTFECSNPFDESFNFGLARVIEIIDEEQYKREERKIKMTYEEAIKSIKETLGDRFYDCVLDDKVCELAIDSLERQIPKKPIVLRKFHDLRCPVCKGYVETEVDEYRYCPTCGQRIDWSEQECTGSSEDEYNTVRNSKGE